MTRESENAAGSAASVWNQEASAYDAPRQTDPVYSSCIHMVMREIPEGTSFCIDAGCGTGLSTAACSHRCSRVVAVDYSLESLKILRSKKLQNVIAVQADLTSLPFKDSVFDACTCANTLQHLKPDGPQNRAVSELQRVTKENGIISVSVHHYSRTKQKAGWVKAGKPGQPGIDYIFRFGRDDLQRLFPGSHMKAVGYYALLRVPFLGSRVQNIVGAFLGRVAALLGYGHMLVASARKSSRGK